jgi:hypothetical protein
MGFSELLVFMVSILASTIRIGTPYALSSIGEVLSERVGIVNLGLWPQWVVITPEIRTLVCYVGPSAGFF